MAKEEKIEEKEKIESEEAVETTTPDSSAAHKDTSSSKLATKHKDLWRWALSHKKLSLPLAVVLVLAIIMAVPITRYAVLGLALKQSFPLVVIDTQTNVPVSNAKVMLHGISAVTDSKGRAAIKVPVGSTTLAVTKEYYESASTTVVVPIGKPKQATTVTLKATGRQVPIRIVNTVSGKPVNNAVLSVANTKVRTDSKGMATVVVPVGSAQLKAVVKAQGYNDVNVQLTVTSDVVAGNTFKATPAGKVYFLSNQSGKLDVVRSNLDGTERKVVVAGTGKEDKPNTVLLASRDWKYVALLSKRDGGESAKLFLLETATDKLTTMDEGDASFTPYGWSGDRFVFVVNRNKVEAWQPKGQALKSYQASTKKLTLLDETTAEGSSQYNFLKESYAGVYIFDQDVIFTKSLQAQREDSYLGVLRQVNLMSIRSDGTEKKVVKAYPGQGNGFYAALETQPGDLNELYIRYDNAGKKYDEYEDGKVTASDFTDNQFYDSESYHTYIVSPSGKKTLWTEFRDGKNTFFVGDGKGEHGKEIGKTSDEYVAYGWYSDDYLLVTKKSSEMRILPVDGLPQLESAAKVGDYYKPNYLIRGYGYGYGG